SRKSQVKSDLPRLKSLQGSTGENPFLKNLFRCFVGHFFNIHSSFRAVHDHILTAGPVQEDREIIFLNRIWAGVIYVLCNEHFSNDSVRLASLDSDQRAAENIGSDIAALFCILGDGNASLLGTPDLSFS